MVVLARLILLLLLLFLLFALLLAAAFVVPTFDINLGDDDICVYVRERVCECECERGRELSTTFWLLLHDRVAD